MQLPKSLTTVTPFSKQLALFLFIIFPIVGFLLGGHYEQARQYMISSTPTPIPTLMTTTSWQTYTNTKYGFLFEHPSSTKVTVKLQPSYPLGAADIEMTSFTVGNRVYEVVAYINSMKNCHNLSEKKMKFCDDIRDWIMSSFSASPDINKYSKSEIDHRTAYQLKNEDGVLVASKNNVYYISSYDVPYKGLATDQDPIYTHFLSTFKFLK